MEGNNRKVKDGKVEISDTILESEIDSEWSNENNGANFASFARQLQYDRTNFYGNNSYYSPYTSKKQKEPENQLVLFDTLPDEALKQYGKTKFETSRRETTSIFLIDSKNRDRAAFAQPTYFTLKPPRVYKNVIRIQVTQIKLLSSFFYFRAAKGNTFLPVIERGRETINTYLEFPLTKVINIAEGSYNISDLLNTLQIQMNYTPLFYDYPSGFSGFVNAFTANGDLSVNFNQPGDTYFDALNKKYITNPTMDQITSYYWGSRYVGLSQYTINQVKVAYYYPVLYEVLLDTTDTQVYPNLNLNVPSNLLSPDDSVYTHVIFNSSGIDDPVILYLLNANIDLLDKYRLSHTFRYFLINRYQLAYDTNSLRVNIVSLTLNTSLVNLINLNASRNLATAILNIGLTPASFSNTSNALNQAKVIYIDMYNYIQKQFTTYFAVGYATYAADYFLNTNNIIYVQNGLNASGVRTGYTAEYLASGTIPITSGTTQYSDSPGYWPNFISTKTHLSGQSSPFGGGINSDGINPSTSMIPYNIALSNFQFGVQVIDSSNYYIRTNRSSRSVDSLISVKPASYTVLKFRSQTRQTLQVETLPLPYYYRFSDYNKQGLYNGVLDTFSSNVPQKYFSTPYEFLYSSTNKLMDSSNYSTLMLSPVVASMPFQTAFTSSPTLNLNVQSNYVQFEFTAPWPPGILSTGLYAYNTNISFIGISNTGPTISTTIGTPVSAYVYHDRAAFMADIGTAFIRKENPLHYIASNSATTSDSDLTIRVSTFSGQKYYGIFRSQNTSFGNMKFSPVVYTDTLYTNIKTDYVNFNPFASPYISSTIDNFPFVSNYNSNYIQLPIYSTLQGTDPSDPNYANNTSIQVKPIGYDISGVSNDLTDYRGYIEGQLGFVPNTIFRIDPVSEYTFQSITPFDSNANSYFGPTSENALLNPVTNDVYEYKGTSSSQIKIVHWYDDYYIPRQTDDAITTTNTIGVSQTVSSIQRYVSGYPVNSNGGIQFGRGINAIGFLPNDGVYEVSSFTFKSAIYPLGCISTTAEDPNTLIKYIGVFTGTYLANTFINLSSARTVLTFTKSQVYGPSTLALTPGFGIENGTWYEYGYDPSFLKSCNVNITGYTPGSNELLSYDSMYYMVPFNSAGSNITFTNLTGSIVPYPLSQVASTGTTYFGQTAKPVEGNASQLIYIMPSTIANANSDYGPQGLIPYTQSQYEQSQAIMTNSIGFKDFQKLVKNEYAIFPFTVTFSNSISTISTASIGLTTFISEYTDTFYLVNSLSNQTTISNVGTSFQGAQYSSSISTTIGLHGGTVSSMQYLIQPHDTVNNYSFVGMSNYTSTILFESMANTNSNVTVRKLELYTGADIATVWLWGGGGATWYGDGTITGPSNYTGGAGAYAKAKINVQTLVQQYGISTLYLVVGKGGNRDNYSFSKNGTQIQNYEQPRYGGGGTSIMEASNGSPVIGNISLQGGGFSGLFFGSNAMTSQPLIIVGGGGAGGAYTMGGPGGFGIESSPLPIEYFIFKEIKLTTEIGSKINIKSVLDMDDNNNYPLVVTSSINNTLSTIDGNYTTFYSPRTPAYDAGSPELGAFINAFTGNLYLGSGSSAMRTFNTFKFKLTFNSNVSTISKLRVYSANINGTKQRPNGFIVYSDTDKAQMLYSNTGFPFNGLEGITQINNGSFMNDVYDLPITQMRSNTVNNTNGWLTCGTATSQYNTIQYSLDGSNWANIRSQTGYKYSTRILWEQSTSGIFTFPNTTSIKSITANNWAYTAYSIAGYNDGCFLSFTVGEITGSLVIGLSEIKTPAVWNPTYAFNILPSFVAVQDTSNTYTGTTSFTSSTVFSIFYNGDTITWYIDGVVKRSRAASINNPLYLVVTSGSSVGIIEANNIIFYPVIPGSITPTPLPDFTPLTTIKDVIYANNGYWYACGSNTIMRSSNGLDWSATGITISGRYTGSLNTLAAGNSRIIAGGTSNSGTTFLYTTDGLNWSKASSGSFSNPVTSIRLIGTRFWAMGPTNTLSLKYSSDGATWSDATNSGITTGALDIAYSSELFTYVVAMGAGAAPGNRQIMYCRVVSNLAIPIIWLQASSVNLANFTCNTITYGNGVFVAGGTTTDGSSPAKYSYNGVNWYNTDIIPSTAATSNIASVYGYSNIHQNGTTIYSYSTPTIVVNIIVSINKITYDSNSQQFISMGSANSSESLTYNKLSVFKSSNGINWTLTQSGGYPNKNFGTETCLAYSGNYGPLSIIPNLSTLYVEILRPDISVNAPPTVALYEIQAFGKGYPIDPVTPQNSVSTIYDSDLTTFWQPDYIQTVGVTDYTFSMTFSTVVSSLSKLDFYVNDNNTNAFTGLNLYLNSNANIVYNNTSITSADFEYIENLNIYKYEMPLIPALSNISTLYLDVIKNTPGIIINEIKALNDKNTPVVQYIPSSVIDAEGYGPLNGNTSFSVNSLIDGNLNTIWYSDKTPSGTIDYPSIVTAKFTFSPPAEKINYIQLYNGNPGVTGATGIVVYSDISKTTVLYSNTSFGRQVEVQGPIIDMGTQYLQYLRFSFNILPVTNVSELYIDFYRNYGGVVPIINEIEFISIGNIGLIDTSAGYSAGSIANMERNTLANNLFDAGAGSNDIGGFGGKYDVVNGSNVQPIPTIPVASNGLFGKYLIGGSPATAGQTNGNTSYCNIKYGAGGGGGGYYGGGGGGIIQYNGTVFQGGGGGGGSGFFNTSTSLLTLLDYGVAVPGDIYSNTPSNYIAPKLSEQSTLIGMNLMPQYATANGYGGGGVFNQSYAQGQHGAIVINFDAPATVNPIGTATATPAYVDASKLSLFNAPITYSNEVRTLPFNTYSDSIQSSQYSNYNWVWYRTYLSLTGATLSPITMQASSRTPVPPTVAFPNLPSIVYFAIEEQFANVSSFFGGMTSLSNDIIYGIEIAFDLFNQYFTETVYTEPKYIEMTEIYCILDYLRQSGNLIRPHIDSLNAPLSRVFGGLPRFGYWANPFLTNASYVGFDTGPSLFAPPQLAAITGNSNPVQAAYGLVLEQSISSGKYIMKDVMAYKPSASDASNYGSRWLTATQFPEAYVVRNLSNYNIASNIPVQPYTMKSAITGQLSLFNYKVYTTPIKIGAQTFNSPIQMINDFQSQYAYFYTFQNLTLGDVSTIHLKQLSTTSTMIQINQANITTLSNTATNIIGTVVSEYAPSTVLQAVSQFGINYSQTNTISPITQRIVDTLVPVIKYSVGSNNYYNSYSVNSRISSVNVGKGMTDYLGNLYVGDRLGGNKLYENVCTIQIYQQAFSNSPLKIASPSHILGQYNSGITKPYYDFFTSRYKNLWHLQGTSNLSTIYGARLESSYDFTITTNFANQIFYPTHKIILRQTSASVNPITDLTDLSNYPSYPRTQMFFYRNFSTLVRDISGQFALEKSSNFAYADTKFSGYFFNSYMQNISMSESTDFNNANPDTFNYLAIRAYSPSESFKALVRFYLPGRYDFGYIALKDLSNEYITLQSNTNVNPEYVSVLNDFTMAFDINRTFGGTGLPGFTGSNITSVSFGDFLKQYSQISATINSNNIPVSTVTGNVLKGTKELITGDLQYIIPSYVSLRERVYDPLEFKLPFSTIAQNSNRTIEEYSMGYNLGFVQKDTSFNTIQRAGSFFKILDDYIYMKMNEEYNMNSLDISRQENFATTHDTQAESKLYNCKLMLNNFGTYATTLVQNPVLFNPPIGKLDKLTFTWYDATGAVIDNAECEWSGAIQIVESLEIANDDSTIPKM